MIVVLNNIRSCWNVGSVMRTCDGVGADLILVGYTPRPAGPTLKMINKTAIGAENSVKWEHFAHYQDVFVAYPDHNHLAVEISGNSRDIVDYLKKNEIDTNNLILWFGNEISGLESDLVEKCSGEIHLPMRGVKESLNVATTVTAFCYSIDTIKRFKQN